MPSSRTTKRHNYTQPYGVNVAKRNAPLFILRVNCPFYIRLCSRDFRGGAYSLKLPIFYHLVNSRRTTPPREHTSPALIYFSHISTTNHDGRTKNTIPHLIPPPTLPTTTIPSPSRHFSIKYIDYLLRYILHGTAKQHKYTQP
jgi:hypothetical protein